ncbi:MAG: hypothetical protein M3Y65_16865 [Pseudomonadota bacterium]|nr:hypothetical protein [Pseudomonadota bacterium]
MTMEQVGPPVALAVSLIEAKNALRIDDDDTAYDLLVEIWIRGVTAEAEHTTRCCFVNRPMRVTLDGFSNAVRLAAPTYSVQSVKFNDATGEQQTLDPQDYFVDKVSRPGYVVPGAGKAWPSTAAVNAVVVDFTAGYGADATTVPDCARLYILARLAEQWEVSTKSFVATSQSQYLTRLLDPIKVYG